MNCLQKKYLRFAEVNRNNILKRLYKNFGMLAIKMGRLITNPLTKTFARIKYIARITYFTPLSFFRSNDYKHQSYLGAKKALSGPIRIYHPDQRICIFLRGLKKIEELTLNFKILLVAHNKMYKSIKKIYISKVVNCILSQTNSTSIQEINEIMHFFSKKAMYRFKIPVLSGQDLNVLTPKYLKHLYDLKIWNCETNFIPSLLLKSGLFRGMKKLSLTRLIIDDDFPSMMTRNFSLMENLEILHCTFHCLNYENTLWVFSCFLAPVNCKRLKLKFLSIEFPDETRNRDWPHFETFARNIDKIKSLEEFNIQITPFKNFIFINNLLGWFPTIQSLKKLHVSCLKTEDRPNTCEDDRIKMKNLIAWSLSCPKLEKLHIHSTNKDYTGLRDIVVPEPLKIREIDFLIRDTLTHDILNSEDYQTFQKFLNKLQNLQSLSLSIQSSEFGLHEFNQLCEFIGHTKLLEEVNLDLNCHKFEITDFGLLVKNLSVLHQLNLLSLIFRTRELIEQKLSSTTFTTNLFQPFQKLKEFSLSLYFPSIHEKMAYLKIYYLNEIDIFCFVVLIFD